MIDAVGKVEFVAESGYPRTAVLHSDGSWRCADPDLDSYLNSWLSPLTVGQYEGDFGEIELQKAAKLLNGQVVHLRLPSPPQQDEEVF